MRWTLRPMRPADIEPILRLALHNQPHGRPTRLLVARALTDPSTRILVIRASHSLVGYAIMRLLKADRTAYLNAIAVDRLYRRNGLARRLLNALLAECRVGGIARVQLDVAESNTPARKLYESLAFQPVSRQSRFYADGESALHMQLSLAGAAPGSAAP